MKEGVTLSDGLLVELGIIQIKVSPIQIAGPYPALGYYSDSSCPSSTSPLHPHPPPTSLLGDAMGKHLEKLRMSVLSLWLMITNDLQVHLKKIQLISLI